MGYKIVLILAICIFIYVCYYIKSIDLSESKLDAECFYLNESHVGDLKNMSVTWDIAEAGAPMICTSITDFIFPGKIITNDFLKTRNEWVIKGTIFEIYLDSAELAASEYSFINPFYNDRLHMDRVSHMPKVAELYKNEKIKFNFTDQHAKLLKSVNAGLSDYIIGINPKRPYGDATYFEPDMADILGIKYSLNSKKHAIMSKEQLEEMRELHYELLPALQVLLIYGSIKTGKYCRDTSYYSRWQKF